MKAALLNVIGVLGLAFAFIILAEASFMERAGVLFSPLIMKRTNTKNGNQEDNPILERRPLFLRNSDKSIYSMQHRSLKEIGGTALDASKIIIFDNTSLWKSISIIGFANAAGCVISLLTGSHLHLDIIGTGAFAAAALAQSTTNPRVRLSRLCVTIWSLKLGLFLFFRMLKTKHDARLDDTLSTASGTVGFWVISALWGITCGLPHYIGSTSSDTGNSITISVGTAIYAIGLLIETVADFQKIVFKNSYPRKFCNVGLWSISQHPNFLGNLVLWAGILFMNATSLVESSASASVIDRVLRFKRLGFALLSPLFMWILFYGQSIGLITNSVALAKEKYGEDPNYKKYVESVPLIIPRLFPSWK